jgi:integrase
MAPRLIQPWKTYYALDGKRVPKGTPDAVKVKEQVKKYYGEGIPGQGKRRVPLATDKTAAQQLLAKKVRQAERGEAGLDDSVTQARRQDIDHHLNDWEAGLTAKGTSVKQVKLHLVRVRNLKDALGWKTLADLDADAVERELARRRALGKKEGGIGAQTSNYYLGSVAQFCRWLVNPKRGRLASNPFGGVERQNVKLDRRHDRRELTTDELTKVLAGARGSTAIVHGTGGEARFFLYLTAAGTGLRASALASLTPESFALDATPPTVTLAARKAKNRKPRVQPLPTALAAMLRPWLAAKEEGQRVWPGVWHQWGNAADLLRHDLAAAGVPYVVEGADGPLFADFHALRHTFLTLMGRTADLRTVQALADHSTPELTARYSHRRLADLAGAVETAALPGLPGPSADALAREQIGTLAALLWGLFGWVFVPPLGCTPGCTTPVDGQGQSGTA